MTYYPPLNALPIPATRLSSASPLGPPSVRDASPLTRQSANTPQPSGSALEQAVKTLQQSPNGPFQGEPWSLLPQERQAMARLGMIPMVDNSEALGAFLKNYDFSSSFAANVNTNPRHIRGLPPRVKLQSCTPPRDNALSPSVPEPRCWTLQVDQDYQSASVNQLKALLLPEMLHMVNLVMDPQTSDDRRSISEELHEMAYSAVAARIWNNQQSHEEPLASVNPYGVNFRGRRDYELLFWSLPPNDSSGVQPKTSFTADEAANHIQHLVNQMSACFVPVNGQVKPIFSPGFDRATWKPLPPDVVEKVLFQATKASTSSPYQSIRDRHSDKATLTDHASPNYASLPTPGKSQKYDNPDECPPVCPPSPYGWTLPELIEYQTRPAVHAAYAIRSSAELLETLLKPPSSPPHGEGSTAQDKADKVKTTENRNGQGPQEDVSVNVSLKHYIEQVRSRLTALGVQTDSPMSNEVWAGQQAIQVNMSKTLGLHLPLGVLSALTSVPGFPVLAALTSVSFWKLDGLFKPERHTEVTLSPNHGQTTPTHQIKFSKTVFQDTIQRIFGGDVKGTLVAVTKEELPKGRAWLKPVGFFTMRVGLFWLLARAINVLTQWQLDQKTRVLGYAYTQDLKRIEQKMDALWRNTPMVQPWEEKRATILEAQQIVEACDRDLVPLLVRKS